MIHHKQSTADSATRIRVIDASTGDVHLVAGMPPLRPLMSKQEFMSSPLGSFGVVKEYPSHDMTLKTCFDFGGLLFHAWLSCVPHDSDEGRLRKVGLRLVELRMTPPPSTWWERLAWFFSVPPARPSLLEIKGTHERWLSQQLQQEVKEYCYYSWGLVASKHNPQAPEERQDVWIEIKYFYEDEPT